MSTHESTDPQPLANPSSAKPVENSAGPASGSSRLSASSLSLLAAVRALHPSLRAPAQMTPPSVAQSSAPLSNSASQVAFLNAIAAKDLSAVEAACQGGADLNFHQKRGSKLWSPLALACSRKWLDGALALIQGGARESVACARWLHSGGTNTPAPADGASGTYYQSAFLYLFSPAIFAALWASEQNASAQDRQDLCTRTLSSRWGVKALVEHQAVGMLDTYWKNHLQETLLDRSRLSSERVDLLRQLLTQHPEKALQSPNRLLGNILRLDDLDCLAVFIEAGGFSTPLSVCAGLHQPDLPEPMRFIQFASRFGSELLDGPIFKMDPASVLAGRHVYEESVGVWAAAVVLGAQRCLKAMASVPELAQETLHNPPRRGWLAMASATDLREAQRQGFDLSLCVNQSGDTPLHIACQVGTSKTRAVQLAQLHPQWMSMRNKEGCTPQECLSADRDHAAFSDALSAVFAKAERQTLRAEVSLPRRARASQGPSSKRRL